MAILYKMVNGERMELSAEETKAREAEEKAWTDSAYDRKMIIIRAKRDGLLDKSDWTDLPNCPLTDAKKTEWQTYRTKLRDITKDVTTIDEANAITFPTKPTT
tara:strand:+ start:191 stop:499 length:309 start_codon:yes stop_codon:yes gene_type:complete